MRTQKDKAIILRRKSFGEADILLTLYTQKNGKVRVIAKGARKITSKMLGFTELFTIISCQIDFKSTIPIISQISHEQLFDGISDNQALYERLHVLAELVDRGCHEQESDTVLYKCLQEGIYQLIATDHPLILASLILRISGILGFEPQLINCSLCNIPLEPNTLLGWNHTHGGVVCSLHLATEIIPLSTDELKVLRYLRRSPLPSIEKLHVSSDFAYDIEQALLVYVQHVLETDFVSQRVGGYSS